MISRTGSASRVLITSRYQVTMPSALQLSVVKLISLKDAELDKKIAALRLLHLQLDNKTPVSPLEQRAIQLGAGNPCLLEQLYSLLVADSVDTASIFQQLTNKQAAFREELSLEILLSYQTQSTRQLCATLALFDIFIPKEVLTAVFDAAHLEPCLQAALAAGLIEVTEERYFVSRLLLPLVVDELDAEQRLTVYATAAECLYALRWKSDDELNAEEVVELIRIAKLGEKQAIFSTVKWVWAMRFRSSFWSFFNINKGCYALN